MQQKVASLRSRLSDHEVVSGLFLSLGSPTVATICGNAGFDWAIIDLEHGTGSEADLLPQILALATTPAVSLVRVPQHGSPLIQRALDLGANGIVIPRVDTQAQAAEAVAATRYPPKGTRGIAQLTHASGFGSRTLELARSGDEERIVVAQIETVDALEEVDAIAATDGVDVVFVGPSDLSMSLGAFWELDRAEYQDALKRVVRAANAAGIASGILAGDPEGASRAIDMGFRFVGISGDAGYLARAARANAASFRR
ncbi:MAG: HpcH/HpaI aldolase family protein [Acidimicrobiales bacterium]